jgi:uncharacterized membrane protein YesL
MAPMAAFRTLWVALVSLYEETLVLVGANFVTLVLNLPLGLVLFLIALPFVSSDEGLGTQWLVALIAWLMPFLPTPGNIALAGLTRVAAGPDVPRLFQFRESLRKYWRLSLKATLVSLVVEAALVWNVTFYLTLSSGWVQFVSILWLYAVILWLSLHIYLLPLAVHVAEPRLIDLYRRAAFIALGHPVYTLVLLVLLLALCLASVIFLPVYLLVAPALISLTQAHALREIRRRHGDLLVETEEEVSRL